jgi:predicted dehydrogenase
MPTGWKESFVRSTRDTIEAIRDGRPPVLTGAQGLDVLKFSFAALHSAQSGRSIALDEVSG